MSFTRKQLGHGAGLRLPHFDHLLEHPAGVGWFEIISENFMMAGGRPLAVLDKVRAEVPVVMHGVSLSIGASVPLNGEYLRQLKALMNRVEPAYVSDHLCWGSFGGEYLHDLLPLPYTEETIDHVSGRIAQVQEYLGRQLLIENVSSYVSFRDSTMSEWEFLAAVAQKADCGILFDVNNIFVSSVNHGFDPLEYINGIPADRVGQFHLAGHSVFPKYRLDTHDAPVCDEVWALYRAAVARFGKVPSLIEWDDKIPSFEELAAVSQKAAAIEAEALRDLTLPPSTPYPLPSTPAPS
jgi:hypothetical protein